MIGNGGEIMEEQMERVNEDEIYVAVGKDVKESKSTLSWALHNSGGRKICILHVHQPAQMIPLMGAKFSASQLNEHQVLAYRGIEQQHMRKLLDGYSMICSQAGVQAEILHTEMESIERGIVELVSQHGIKKLIMGAAANKHYSRKMMDLKSKKATYVSLQAPISCYIWFICKGHLIHTREGRLEGVTVEVASMSLRASANTEAGQASSLRTQSVVYRQNDQLKISSTCPEYRRVMSDVRVKKASAFYSVDDSRGLSPLSRSMSKGRSDEWFGLSGSPSLSSHFSSCSSGEVDDNLVEETIMNDEFYNQLEQTMVEAENSRREVFEESIRRRKAEKDAIEATRRAKAAEILCSDELRKRKVIEEVAARGKEELERLKQQVDVVTTELQIILEQKSSLESQIANSDQMVQELEQKIFTAVELLKNYKKERDDLQVERDNALKLVDELKKNHARKASATLTSQSFCEFSLSEIEEATHNFDPTLKIGEGGYGSIYRGLLRHTQVAIKMLHSHSLQGSSEFQQEVDVLSKLRHPNLVSLIGACPEALILIYEYLPNGSLEDRLSCRDNTPPLSWQTRIRICTDLCSVLIFLHSCHPHRVVVVHGDLKPANILLDANYVTKLGDFGISRVLPLDDEVSKNHTTFCCTTEPKGTFAYMDPEFLATGELSPKSDVYSFGIIVLQLLTGRPALGIAKEMQHALELDEGKLKELLDPTAGDWPFVQAKQLACLALRCCEMNRKSRPDLASDVWRVVEPMRVSCGAYSSFCLGSSKDYNCQTPSYFICPIFQEIMQDPHVAADGFTYEAEALRGWLDSGHDTSPMTNLKLPHCNLVPNQALRSAIQEWLQQQQS